jgi:hypothetical protein
MEFTIKSGSPEKQRSACVVVGVFDNRKLSLSAELIDRASNGYISEILLGALFLLIVLFVPRGIVPTAGEWLRRLRTRGRPAVAPVQTSTRAETRA